MDFKTILLWSIFFLIGLEGLVRILYFLEGRLGWKPRFKVRIEKGFPKILAYHGHPYFLYTKRANMDGLYPSNNLGYAGKRVLTIDKPPGKIRVYCIGGSTVEQNDPNQGPDSHWPAKLQDILNKKLGREVIETINAGISGYTSAESLSEFVFRGQDLKPDFLLIYHNVNDAWWAQMFEGFKSDYSHGRVAKSWDLSIWSRLPTIPFWYSYLVLRATMAFKFGRKDNGVIYRIGDPPWKATEHFDSKRVEPFKRNTRNLIVTARAVGAEPILLNWERDWSFQLKPMYIEGLEDSRIKEIHLQYLLANNQVLKDLAEEFGCSYHVPGPFDSECFIRDGLHFNAKGLELMADSVAKAIFPQIEKKSRKLAG